MGYRHAEANRYRRRARWGALVARLRGPGRFVGTVVASAFLSVLIQEAMPSAKQQLISGARAVKHFAKQIVKNPLNAAPREAAFVPTRLVPGMEQYERYYSEAMPLLRADASVTLLAVEVPAAVLQFQSNGRTKARSAPYALRARSRNFPAVAVSRNARAFLESMRLTFVDPKRLPSSILENIGTPVDHDEFVDRFLIVPDVTGDKAGLFSFQPSR